MLKYKNLKLKQNKGCFLINILFFNQKNLQNIF